MRKTLIIGATSAIAEATARRLAREGDRMFLIARDRDKLEVVAADLRARGADLVEVAALDVLDFDRHDAVLQKACDTLQGLDLALLAHGTLPDQQACQASFTLAHREFDVNATSVMSLVTWLANYLERQHSGTIAVISSVAGDRGRQSNYLYGAAKGAVSLFLQGVRNRLYRAGVKVLTIKPGFVDTPMTAAFDKGPLWAQPDDIAEKIMHALRKGHDVVYAPGFWRLVMLVIKLIPETLFKRLSL